MDLKARTAALKDEVIELRRDFHRHPELGFAEERTAEKAAAYLSQCGLEVRRGLARTGLVGLLRGTGPGRTLLLRADMDALPVEEQTGAAYCSVNPGIMHACGHDGHTAMLLVAAKVLAGLRDRFRGSIKFAFQPNEEGTAAGLMIEDGVLLEPRVEAALAIHLWSGLASGTIAVGPGPVMAGLEEFSLILRGRGGHTAAPHLSADPILAAAHLVQASQMVQTHQTDALKPTVIGFGRIAGGGAANVIPERVELAGTIRCLHDQADQVRELFRRIIVSVCQAHGVEYELETKLAHPAVINHPALAELVRSAAIETLGGPDRVVSLVSMVGEDFSRFTERLPGAIYLLGSGDEAKGTTYPHHHPRFDIDEDVLPLGVEMHVRTALAFLETDEARPPGD